MIGFNIRVFQARVGGHLAKFSRWTGQGCHSIGSALISRKLHQWLASIPWNPCFLPRPKWACLYTSGRKGRTAGHSGRARNIHKNTQAGEAKKQRKKQQKDSQQIHMCFTRGEVSCVSWEIIGATTFTITDITRSVLVCMALESLKELGWNCPGWTCYIWMHLNHLVGLQVVSCGTSIKQCSRRFGGFPILRHVCASLGIISCIYIYIHVMYCGVNKYDNIFIHIHQPVSMEAKITYMWVCPSRACRFLSFSVLLYGRLSAEQAVELLLAGLSSSSQLYWGGWHGAVCYLSHRQYQNPEKTSIQVWHQHSNVESSSRPCWEVLPYLLRYTNIAWSVSAGTNLRPEATPDPDCSRFQKAAQEENGCGAMIDGDWRVLSQLIMPMNPTGIWW